MSPRDLVYVGHMLDMARKAVSKTEGISREVKQYQGQLFAAVNNGANTVALYTREGGGLMFDKLVTTTSPPLSVDFGNDHMYVAGATTVDSFVLHGNHAEWRDGTTFLELAK